MVTEGEWFKMSETTVHIFLLFHLYLLKWQWQTSEDAKQTFTDQNEAQMCVCGKASRVVQLIEAQSQFFPPALSFHFE